MLVHTSETVRLRYFLDLLLANGRPVMLVGGAGCGKTVLVNDKLSSMREDYLITTIPFNHYTTSLMLQGVMEKPLEKKAGTVYVFNNLLRHSGIPRVPPVCLNVSVRGRELRMAYRHYEGGLYSAKSL